MHITYICVCVITTIGLRSRNAAHLINLTKPNTTTTNTAAIALSSTINTTMSTINNIANAATATLNINTNTNTTTTNTTTSNNNTNNNHLKSFIDYFRFWLTQSNPQVTTLLVHHEPSPYPGIQKTITTLQKMTPRDRIILGIAVCLF